MGVRDPLFQLIGINVGSHKLKFTTQCANGTHQNLIKQLVLYIIRAKKKRVGSEKLESKWF